MSRHVLALTFASILAAAFVTAQQPARSGPLRFSIRLPTSAALTPVDGRLLLIISRVEGDEPRFQVNDGPTGQPVFGIDADGWKFDTPMVVDQSVPGFPLDSITDVPAGTYTVQALLHKYETFRRGDGHTVKMPMDRGEGQQWARAPGNLYSTPRRVALGATGGDDRYHPGSDDSADRAAEGHEVHPARTNSEPAAHEILGPADASRGERPAA